MDSNSLPDIEALKREFKAREARRRSERLKSAIATVIAAGLGLIASFSQIFDLSESKSKRVDSTSSALVAMQSEVESLKAQAKKTDELITALTTPNPAASISVEQHRLAAALESTDERLKKIESTIIESPERALSIPLLRKDIDESTKRVEEYRAASRSEVDRLYEQQKWILGGIGTVLLAVIGGAVSIIFKSLPKGGGNDA